MRHSNASRPSYARGRLDEVARDAACFAHLIEFQSHRGCYPLKVPEGMVLILYNNAPYRAGREYRARELVRIRQRIDQLGLKEEAFATFPVSGAKAGYTYALVVSPWSMDAQAKVAQVVLDETGNTLRELLTLK
jgi:hypothetical protein